MNTFSPTASDNMKNRLKEFMLYGITQFMERAATEILNSMDKDNIKAKKCTKYFAKVVDVSATGISILGGAGPMAKGIGSAAGTVTEEVIDNIIKKKEHKKSKAIEQFLESFDPEKTFGNSHRRPPLQM